MVSSMQPLSQIAAFLKVQGGKIGVNDDSMPTRVVSKSTTYGYLNIIFQLLKEAKSDLGGCSDVEQAQVRQWIEYGVTYIVHNDVNINPILKELNRVLSTRTYLIQHKLTLADIFLYYLLQETMENLSLIEKEKHMNISRWFDNLQQNSSIRQSNKLIDFNTLYLANVAPVRH